jgi:NAD-dependent DNA ligase
VNKAVDTKSVGGDSMMNPVEVVAELKYDGVAVSLIYEKGKLVRALSRGNGRTGEDITDNVLELVEGLPRAIDTSGVRDAEVVEVRGEVVMRNAVFGRINQMQQDRGDRSYSNPRNLVAGMLNRRKSSRKGKGTQDTDQQLQSDGALNIDGRLPLNLIGYTLLASDGTLP